ncbi:B100 [Murid betaherpesvirus 8]|uniref:B100 n=2 Tax=Rat cytomegalovirus (isolate England) TaxID=1261657 RepID=K7YA63_RCMVE|nr:E100 [Murid betaherpesvirus 8]AKE44267.1 a100 [Rat cytomegalovirus ALL-03]AFX83414.1 E100 [Murid betaherpesvirus 8]AKB93294.1 B100 [Murid betaherpesvirus 8]WPH25009.1 B100 [Murid betaherpesvirus 8]WPH25143.1 B100 [Murid betaherpesvirus 8]
MAINTMTLSHVDRVNVRTWTMSIVLSLISFVNIVIFSIAAHFPGAGFPCYYPKIIDFGNMNLSTYNAIHHLTPQLYLDPVQLVIYVIFTEIIFAIVIIYYIVCWAQIYFRKDNGNQVNQSTRDISCIGDTASCFAFTLTMDAFQIYVLSLSFRFPSMVAFAKCMYFICLTAFVVTFVTHYESTERSAFNLAKIHPKLQGTVRYRTAVVNLSQALLGISTMVLAMSLALGFGNSFFVKTAHVVFGAMVAFAVVSTIYFSIIESILVRYMKVQFGYHIGSILGVCGAMYPIIQYEALNASEYTKDINITLAVLLLLCVIFTTIRVVRFILRRARRYRPLVDNDEIKSLRGDTE